MFARRLRRRPSIKTTLGRYLVLGDYDPLVFKCWPAVFDVGPTLKRHCFNVSCLLGTAPGINNTATLTKCWASVVDGVPALKQRWLHVIVQRYACLLGQSVLDNNT